MPDLFFETKSSISGTTDGGTGDPWTGGPPNEWAVETGSGSESEYLDIRNFGFVLEDCGSGVDGVQSILVELDRLGEAMDSADDRPKNLEVRIHAGALGFSPDDKASENLVWNTPREEVGFTADRWGFNPTSLDPEFITDNAGFGFRVKVKNTGQSDGAVRATVYNVTITVAYFKEETGTGSGTGTEETGTGTGTEETGTGTGYDPLDPERDDIAYIPWSAFINHFLGVTVPTGATQASGDLFLAQFVNTTGDGLGIHYHYNGSVRDEFGNTERIDGSRLFLTGRLSKVKIPFSPALNEVFWGNGFGSLPVIFWGGIPGTVQTATRYTGFRCADISFGFVPNCVVDTEGNIVHFLNDILGVGSGGSFQRLANTYDYRMVIRRTFYRVGSGDWTLGGTYNFGVKTQSMAEQLQEELFYYSFGFEPAATATITWVILNVDHDSGTEGGESWSTVDPGWAFSADKITNTNQIDMDPGQSEFGVPLYKGWPILPFVFQGNTGTDEPGGHARFTAAGDLSLQPHNVSNQLINSGS